MSADIFSKCRPTYRIFSEMLADIFQNAISNEGGNVVAVRVWNEMSADISEMSADI